MRTAEGPRAPAGRPQDPAIETAILRATQDLLIESGFSGMTVDAVARAAGSGKAAVYRRWSSKTELAIAAVRAMYFPPSVPDTGSLRGDLRACAAHYAGGNDRSARVLASVLSEIIREPDLGQAAYQAIGAPPAEALGRVLRRWADRGVIAAGAPVDLLAGIIPAVAFRTMCTARRALDRRTAEDLVDHVLMPALTGGRPGE